MNQTFETIRVSRKLTSQFLENYSLEQLNKIPEGFNNNIIWNIAHVIVTQQLLVYKLSGLPMMVSDELVDKYRKGTKPDGAISQTELDEIKSLLFETINQTEADYNAKVFKSYNELTTSLGFTLNDIEDALPFNNYHEALHVGIMMSIQKFI
ncbi:DinB family protein [Flavobacterium sp. LS1R47]|uniref:DinB family protein n=1 Tax=Flavobacterium frigoritolerans TaxID=2987686 RepID=A0A9X3C0Q1_9FLAO|nr:DinB family protein [Flavobacterium frigoritolerans]MCV9932020.1 DinB family protein [Flavobacterium frigoritolerans]